MLCNICKINIVLFLVSAVLLSAAGCGNGKKKTVVKNYGKPQWYQIDPSKFVELSKDETTPPEGSGKIIIYDPVGWERTGKGKAPSGFTSVIRFQKGEATILMTKSKGAKDMDDLDKENIEGFAESAQQLFKTKVEMVELGNIIGVMFRKAGKASQSVSGKKFERRVVATSIGGELYTYELIANAGKISNTMLYTLFSIIARTKIEGMAAYEPEVAKADKAVDNAVDKKETVSNKPAEVAAVEKKEEKKEEAKPEESKPAEVAAAEKKEEKKEEAKPKESRPAEVAAAEKKEEKKEEAKSETKPEKKKKKGDTKNILNELDALLNN